MSTSLTPVNAFTPPGHQFAPHTTHHLESRKLWTTSSSHHEDCFSTRNPGLRTFKVNRKITDRTLRVIKNGSSDQSGFEREISLILSGTGFFFAYLSVPSTQNFLTTPHTARCQLLWPFSLYYALNKIAPYVNTHDIPHNAQHTLNYFTERWSLLDGNCALNEECVQTLYLQILLDE